MSLKTGSRLGPYEITSLIGAGGMGEVYRARDTRLERDVAIKILTTRLELDSRSISRFRVEAKAIAALSHPNILSIFDAELQQSPLFLVTEFLEGETLRSLLQRTQPSWRQVAELGAAVADALAAAHSAGVIHRDLKPENLFLTNRHSVKILDFGLAQFKREFAASAGSVASTVSDVNVVLGTVGYMSPEQARGEALTPASDIFSLGCVLYEMVTGRGAFHRSTPASTLAAILNEQPRRVSAYSSDTPPELDRWIRHCLEKDPDRRPQSARDLVMVLRDLLDTDEHERRAGVSPATPIAAATESSSKLRPVWKRAFVPWAFAFAAVIASLVSTIWFRQAKQDPELPVRRFSFRLPMPATGIGIPLLAVSPNGRHVAIIAGEGQKKLWVQDLDKEQPRLIAGSDDASGPFWSPDSALIGFASAGKLRKVPVGGGIIASVCDMPGPGTYMGGGSWSPDGSSIVFSSGSPAALYSVSAAGGSARPLLSHKELNLTGPEVPGGRAPAFAWMVHPHFVGNSTRAVLFTYGGSLLLHDLGSRQTRVVGPGSNAAYASSGHLLYKAGNDLWAQKFSLAVRVARDAVEPSVAPDGTLVYLDLVPEQLIWLDRRGARSSAVGQTYEAVYYPALSPKHDRIAVETLENRNQDVWVVDITRGTRVRLSSHPASEVLPVWSPDGTQVAFSSYRAGNTDIFVRTADGSTDEISLASEPQNERVCDWSPDGQYILYSREDPQTRSDLWYLKRNSSGGWDQVLFLKSISNEKIAKFSPDGRYVAYLSDESGRDELYVRQFPSGASRWPVSTGGASQVRWSRNGKELFYVEAGSLMTVTITAGPGFAVGPATRLFSHPAFTTSLDANYDISADAQRFLVPQRVQSESPKIRVVQNWVGEFRGRR
jgi:eukaryotic-like serine/threonine-protein kinase